MSDTISAVQTQGQARSKASQEKSWSSVLNLARRIVTTRPDDHLVSILADLREVNISRKDPGNYYRIKEMVQPIGTEIMARRGLTVEDRFHYPEVTCSDYRVGTISPIRYLSKLIRPNTTAVIEVGSGWSSNLLQLYLAHGTTRSKKIIYYGGEYTREGQVCGKFLAERDPALKYRAFSFDYRNPNVEFLIRQKGHILLFTAHSVEQVDAINPALFEQLAALPNPVTVVHFEPVGWQRDPELLRRREVNDTPFFEAIGAEALRGEIASVVRNAAWWSWRLEYNRNLVPIIARLESESTIQMVRNAWDFSGAGNVLNPSSLIHYEFVR